jgi:hypothetical protein
MRERRLERMTEACQKIAAAMEKKPIGLRTRDIQKILDLRSRDQANEVIRYMIVECAEFEFRSIGPDSYRRHCLADQVPLVEEQIEWLKANTATASKAKNRAAMANLRASLAAARQAKEEADEAAISQFERPIIKRIIPASEAPPLILPRTAYPSVWALGSSA